MDKGWRKALRQASVVVLGRRGHARRRRREKRDAHKGERRAVRSALATFDPALDPEIGVSDSCDGVLYPRIALFYAI